MGSRARCIPLVALIKVRKGGGAGWVCKTPPQMPSFTHYNSHTLGAAYILQLSPDSGAPKAKSTRVIKIVGPIFPVSIWFLEKWIMQIWSTPLKAVGWTNAFFNSQSGRLSHCSMGIWFFTRTHWMQWTATGDPIAVWLKRRPCFFVRSDAWSDWKKNAHVFSSIENHGLRLFGAILASEKSAQISAASFNPKGLS